MRILRPIVFSQALLMVAAKPEILKGSAVGAQLVGRHPRRREALLAEQLAHQLDSRRPVSTTLDQDLEDLAFVVDGTPQMPAIRTTISSRCQRSLGRGRHRRRPRAIAGPNLSTPTANALVGEVEPTLGKQFLDIAIA